MRFIEITPQQKHTNAPPIPKEGKRHSCESDARNHYPRIKHHTPPPSGATTVQPPPRAATPTTGARTPRHPKPRGEEATGLLSQDPTVCLAVIFDRRFPTPISCSSDAPGPAPTTGRDPSIESPTASGSHDVWAGANLVVLLRKEVIQPHLPVRLPCYDFVPIADPTFDGSLPRGVRPPASGVTDFHDVTGGVYKARERIHRSVADLRLLATPTSRGRVADPDPN